MPAGNGSSTGATASAAQLRNANSAQMQAAAAARLAALQAAGHQQQMQMQQQQLALQQQQQRLGIGLGNNRLGCSCGTVPRKGFRCDETPAELKQMGPQHSQQQHHPLQQPAHQASAHQHQSQHATRSMMAAVDAVSGQRKDAHILRLWAEVFHVSAAPNGGVRWQQMSDDLVPVNVRYMAEGVNRCSFHISAYNTMVDKVLDVRVPQPGTRLGQASECFVYWKDSSTNDTWGLNFTSPVDARTFRQLCSAPAPRATMPANGTAGGKGRAMKAGEAVGGRRPVTRGTKKKPQSTPSSPSARRSAFIEDQQHMQQLPCTCGPTVDQQQQQQPTQQPMARPRNTKIRYAAATSSTLPKCMFRQDGRLVAYPSTTNLMPSGAQKGQPGQTVPALVRSHTALGATSRPASSAAMSSSAAQHRTQYATRSAMSRSVESAQPSNVRQQLALAQQHQMCRLAACQARASELSPADARSRSKSTEDVRRSVATTTEDLTGQAAAVAGAGPTVAQTNGHVSRRMMATQALNQTGQVAPAQMTAQPIGAQVPIDSRTMTYRSATGSVCPMPNCGVPLQSYGQQPPPGMTMTNGMNGQMARNMIRPTSVPNWTLPSEDSIEADMRSRLYRSETGRRRSLERSACVDLTDQSPPSDKLILDSLRKAFVQQQQQQMHMQKVAQTQQQAQQANHLQQQMAAAAVAAVTPAMYRTATQLMSQTDASKSQTATHAVGRSVQITSDAKPSGPGRDTTGTAVPIERSPSPHDKSGKNGSTSNVATVAANNLSQFLTSRVLAATDKQQHSIGADGQRSSSPTVRLLHEYESQLRELLARGNSVELENSSLHSFEALLSQSMENVVSLMREVQSELDAIRREEQQIRARSESNSAANSLGPTRPHSSAGIRTSLASNAAALATASRSPWARSNTLPSRHSLGVNANGTASRSQPTLNDALGSTAYGLSTNVLHAPSADWTRSLRKRASAPYLFDQLTAPTAHDSLWAAQASFESNDSRAFLTSSELSDEDKLSMNTAMSDDEGDLAASARSALDSPKSGQPASGVIHCGGAIRKAGFLCVKKWLLRRPNGCSSSSANVGNGLSVELARRRGWRSYWVCLKGTTLLFYRSEQSAAELSHDPLLLTEDSIAPEQRPKHLLVVDGALVQPIPEHPKRDFVFCLSTVLGDAYLFQAPCQLELEHWTAEIHCACAAALSRHRGRSGTLHLLDETLNRLQRRLDTEAKLRHVAELQLSAQNDLENRRVAQSQLRSHEEALELCCVEQYRLRCYIASLLEREQPNPKTLLAHCSKGTKALLNRLGK